MVSEAAFDASSPVTRLIGKTVDALRDSLGPPDVEHRQGDDTWLIFRTPDFDLRIRCAGAPDPIARSCTATLTEPAATLARATARLGLWPTSQPDVTASTVDAPLVRRALPGSAGELFSLTATVRAGHFSQVTVFDEEPEWMAD